MKNYRFITLIAATALLGSCSGNKETKTLYGLWEPILVINDSTNTWKKAEENFIISVSGKCEEIVVERTEMGDLANPDVVMPDAKCSGNRDELTFRDTMSANTVYALKMDASKDTLTGTATTDYNNDYPTAIVKIKFFRIGANDAN